MYANGCLCQVECSKNTMHLQVIQLQELFQDSHLSIDM